MITKPAARVKLSSIEVTLYIMPGLGVGNAFAVKGRDRFNRRL